MTTDSPFTTEPKPPGSKEKILRRIREALQSPAPRRHLGHGHGAASSTPPAAADPEQWLPPVPAEPEGRAALFASISESLKTQFIPCRDITQARTALADLASAGAWKTVYLHGDPLVQSICANLPNSGITCKTTDLGYEKSDLAAADAGVTGCEALVAQTGSILVSPQSSGGRVLSVLVPHHVVVARSSQMSRDLREALAALKTKYHGDLPPYLSFITGPSRTGDIERILVLGAHGPKELTVILVDE